MDMPLCLSLQEKEGSAKMHLFLSLLIVGILSQCSGKKAGRSSPPPSQPSPEPISKSSPTVLDSQTADIVEIYRKEGIELTLEPGQKLSPNPFVHLLPQIKSRFRFIKWIQVYKPPFFTYHHDEKRLDISLEYGFEAIINYLHLFDKLRDLEIQLNGITIDTAMGTSETLTNELDFFERIQLKSLLQNRPYVKRIDGFQLDYFWHDSGILSLNRKTDHDTATKILTAADRWFQLISELGLDIIDNTNGLSSGGFFFNFAIESFWKKIELIKPVIKSIKRIEIQSDSAPLIIDLQGGVIQISSFDVEDSDTLWQGLASYEKLISELPIPIEVSSKKNPEETLKMGCQLLLSQIEVLKTKVNRIKSIRLETGERFYLDEKETLFIGTSGPEEELTSYLESL
jgi:hypothetical protein